MRLEVQVIEDAPHLRAGNPYFVGQGCGDPVSRPVTGRIRRLLGDGLDHLEAVVVAVDQGTTRAETVLETRQSLASEPGTPLAHSVGIDRQPLCDLSVGKPIGGQQLDPCPLHPLLLSPPGPQAGLQLPTLLGVQHDGGGDSWHADLRGYADLANTVWNNSTQNLWIYAQPY